MEDTEESLWFRIEKSVFQLENNMFHHLAIPLAITTKTDYLGRLNEILIIHKDIGDVLFVGDLNARTGNEKSLHENYNHFLNILRLFDVLPDFPFTTSETKHNY